MGGLSQGVSVQAWKIVQKWLSKKGNPRWLLALDECDPVSLDIAEVFPNSGSRHIIITARDLEVPAQAGGTPIYVQGMGAGVGLGILLRSAGVSLEGSSAAGMSHSLVYNPLWVLFELTDG